MIVNLQIERLVFDGLPLGAHDAPLVQAAVEAELARLLAAGGGAAAFVRDHSAALVRTDPILAPGADAHEIGTLVANTIFGGIGP